MGENRYKNKIIGTKISTVYYYLLISVGFTFKKLATIIERASITEWCVNIITFRCSFDGLYNVDYYTGAHYPYTKFPSEKSYTVYIPPGLLPTGTLLNIPISGLTSLAKYPNGGGLIDDSGTSRTYLIRRDS